MARARTQPAAAPAPATYIAPTAPGDVDGAVAAVRERAADWCATDVAGRLELLRQLTEDTFEVAPAWTAAVAEVKGLRPDSPLAGEEWGAGVAVTLRALKGLRASLSDILATGRPQPPSIDLGPTGQVVAKVFPADWIDRVSLPGFTAEVRLQAGVGLPDALARIGRVYRDDHEPAPAVAGVLGAGNNASIPLFDVLHQLFTEDRVVVLKMSPVNDYLGPVFEQAFGALIAAGFLRIVYGGEDVASRLIEHDDVDAIHLTGAARTHDLVVFGAGEEGERRKAAGEPRLDKPVTAELGNVTPVIVVPGPWRRSDIAYHGHNIASMLTHNAGFNCLAARMIVQHRAWARRTPLLEAVRESLRRAEQRVPYYPGAREQWERSVTEHRSAEWFGSADDGEVPFTLIPELEPDVTDDPAFTTEPFCGVMGEVALDAPRSVPDFVDAAVEFCNETLVGSLCATIIVHPASLRDPLVAQAVERAIDELRYGTVVVNHFPAVAFGMASTSWGAYPGAVAEDIGSGRGVVHNTYLLEDVEKSVVRGPFRTPQTPAWFHTNRRTQELWQGIARVTATASRAPVPALLWNSARG